MRKGADEDQRPYDSICVPALAKKGLSAQWHRRGDKCDSGSIVLSADAIIELLAFVVENSYVAFGGLVFKQIMGIAMGTNAGPFIATIFCYSFELQFLMRQLRRFVESCNARPTRSTINARRATLAQPLPPVLLFLFFNGRYIDDIFNLTFYSVDVTEWFYDRRGEGGHDGIYPTQLQGPHGMIEMPLKLNIASDGDSVNHDS